MGHVTPATAVMVAIDTAMRKDQGAAFRQWQEKVLPHLGDAYRGEDEAFRGHLGASVLGNECGRAIWYGFRWATRKEFSGQVLRLFNRGHLEEGRFIAMLLSIGVELVQQDEAGNQFRISFAEGHGGGSGDGFARNVPGMQADQWVQAEFKTHNQRSFDDLAGSDFRNWFEGVCGRGPKVPFSGKGVRESKPDHYFQMQTYMRKFGLAAALYGAVCKNTDDVYFELVPVDTSLADQLMERATKIVWLHDAPEKIKGGSAGWYKCKFCDHMNVCHKGAKPDMNCRTCAYSEPRPGGFWVCKNPVVSHGHESVPLSRAEQLKGCSHHEVKKSM